MSSTVEVLSHYLVCGGVDRLQRSDTKVFSELESVALSEGVLSLWCDQNLIGSVHKSRDEIDRFRQIIKAETAAELLQAHYLREAFSLLARNNIRFLVFKGTALAYSLYSQPYIRSRCDTDILFANRSDADRAASLLTSLEYFQSNAVDGDLITAEFCCVKSVVNGGTVVLDMHWHTNNAIQYRALDFEILYSKAEVVGKLSGDALAPCMEHAFILACQHRLAHESEGSHNRLIWLYDLHLLLQYFSRENWQSLVECIKSFDLAPVCHDGIASTRQYFATTVDGDWFEVIELLAKKSDAQIEHADSLLKADFLRIKHQKGLGDKLLMVKEYLLPDAAYIQKKYQIQHRILLPFYYCLRIVQGVLKRF